jgi:hypothetical protein
MSRRIIRLCAVLLLISWVVPSLAQQTATVVNSASGAAVVPPLVSFDGVLTDLSGKRVSAVTGVTFALYKDEQGGAPLWLEKQNVYPDKTGHYTVTLGLTRSTGLPSDIFVQAEARWLGVQSEGQPEQPRILLMSVPYALKAGDAQSVGGFPASAFVLAAPPNANGPQETSNTATASPAATSNVTTTGGTVNALPLWTTATNIQSSLLTQSGSGTTAKIGINTTTPGATLDVNGAETVRGPFTLPASGTATATKGFKSQPQDFVASVFSSGTSAAVPQKFQWQAEPINNNTATASGTLNLLYAAGTSAAAETGLKVNSKGLLTFASGQTFPGTGNGTITAVTAGTDLMGGGTSGDVTLKLDTTKVPQLAAANTFTGNQTVNGNLSATGVVTGSSYQIGSNLFAYGSYANANAFLGFAGNTTTTGTTNTASGYQALASNTTGQQNTANGYQALLSNTIGGQNTAIGEWALQQNSSGADNVAIGIGALQLNTTGNDNTAIGVALARNSTGSTNIAIGLDAMFVNTTGGNNTAVGNYTIGGSDAGNYNTAIGHLALYSNPCDASYNTGVGYAAGYISFSIAQCGQGNYNTFLGANTKQTDLRFNNATAIGANAEVAESNALVLGGINGVNGATSNTNVGIGTVAPSRILTIGQGFGHAIADGWDTYSSRRWKTNIRTLQASLAKVEQLRGVSYDRKDSGKHEIGVIAEEVGAVVPEVVTYEKNATDASGVDYGRLTALLIEATKEQQALIQQQQKQIQAQKAQIKQLARQVREVQAAMETSSGTNSEIRTVK